MAKIIQLKESEWLNSLKTRPISLPLARNTTHQQTYTQTKCERIELDIPCQQKGKKQD